MFSKILSIFEKPKDSIIVTEGVESTWHYHLSYQSKFSKSLCGITVMHTSLPLDAWGYGNTFKRKVL